jgi:alpha-tubulin suppressor-like RCC1 family protein
VATKTDGTLWAWGGAQRGGLGLNNEVNRSSPTQVGILTTWLRVNAGSSYCCIATRTDGTLWTWGNNSDGRLGLNDQVYRSSPVQVGTNTNWNQIDLGRPAIATKTDGTLWVWGPNNFGQLGLNNVVDRSSPTQVGIATNWNLVSAGIYHASATTNS